MFGHNPNETLRDIFRGVAMHAILSNEAADAMLGYRESSGGAG
jgi:hypothetical protein